LDDHILFGSSANNKDLSQSISTLTQKLAVQNASDNTSSVQKQPGSHNVQTTPTNLPTSNRFAVLADLKDSIQDSTENLVQSWTHSSGLDSLKSFVKTCTKTQS
jgi:hypothetical protein